MKQHQTPVYYVPKRKFHTPIQEALGHYESWLFKLKGSKSLICVDKMLERFIRMFPRKKFMEQFTAVDIADYVLLRRRAGTKDSTLGYELGALCSWWKWLIEDVGLPIRNIIKIEKYKLAKKYREDTKGRNKNSLSLEGVKRLIDATDSPTLKIFLIDTLGGKNLDHWYRKPVYPEWRRLADKLGLAEDITPHTIKTRVGRGLVAEVVAAYCTDLRRQVIETYGYEACYPLPKKPKSFGNPFRAIKVSALNEGATVPDSNDNAAPVVGVVEQQPCAEGQSLVGDSHSQLIVGVPVSPSLP